MASASTVFVVEHDASEREAIKLLVQSNDLAVEAFESAHQFLAVFDSTRPGCVVAAANLPDVDGVELQRRLADQGAIIPFIFVTTSADVSTAVEAMKRGAIDFIESPFDPAALLERIREAIKRDAALREEQRLVNELRLRILRLTPREREVMDLVVAGRSNKEVAAQLNVTEKTVEHHRAHVMRKLQAETVAELVRIAMLSKAAADRG
jgi:FixJ family two-component response regulator